MTVLESIIDGFINLIQGFFDFVFGGVNFSVLWNWLPSDIGQAAGSLIAILFGFALLSYIRKFLPF